MWTVIRFVSKGECIYLRHQYIGFSSKFNGTLVSILQLFSN